MKKVQHTPVPWVVFTAETDDGENVYPKIMTADYQKEILKWGTSSAKKFAEYDFIVKCCNSHDELLDALLAAWQSLSEAESEKIGPEVHAMIRAAIAKARGVSAS